MKPVAILIPALNEAVDINANLSVIQRYAQAIPDIHVTVLVVNDGSSDETPTIVMQRAQQESSIRLLSLSRHCGKEAAIFAGLQQLRKFSAVIVMDSDLQHPPEMLAGMVEKWQHGALVVEAVKTSRGNETLSKGLLVRSYYRLFNFLTKLRISGDTDFKLLDQKVVDAYCALPEHNRFFRGLIKWMNYPTIQIPFAVPSSVRERSSWGNFALFRYAISSITSFTAFPLQAVTMLGGVTFLLSLVVGGIALLDKLSGNAVDGFTTVILLILLIGSILMFSVGLIGIYVGRIYDEVKRRPSYLIDQEKSYMDDLP